MDYFSIHVTTLPIKNVVTGERWSAFGFYELIRKDLDNFIDHGNTSFAPYGLPNSTYDYDLWQSSSPLTSVITINIDPDDGSVI